MKRLLRYAQNGIHILQKNLPKKKTKHFIPNFSVTDEFLRELMETAYERINFRPQVLQNNFRIVSL